MRLFLLSAAALALTPVVASAQTTTDASAPMDATAATQVPEEDDEFPWGLLGLLGLAGLLGAKRRDDRHDATRRTA